MSRSSDRISTAIDQHSDDLRRLSLEIHSHPELGYEEHHAHDVLTKFLDRKGFTVTKHAGGVETAFIAEWEVGGDGNGEPVTIAFLSEYDALPDIGHACGHNLIAISGVAAALACKASLEVTRPPFRTTIKLFGTPAEETRGGKLDLLNANLFNGVDIAIMAHPGNVNVARPFFMAMQELVVEFFGKPAHAAAEPWAGINALDAAVMAYNSVSAMRQQILPTDRVHGIITHGGAAANIIPDYTRLEYYIRSAKIADLRTLKDRITACFQGAATATGCTFKVTECPAYADLKNNSVLAKLFEEEMMKMDADFGDIAVLEKIPRGSTDMGNVTQVIPGIHPLFDIVGAVGKFDIHTKEFERQAAAESAHIATLRCAKALALVGYQCVVDSELRGRVKEDFART
ncbi:amidohydrolase [Spizellomyces punctatus DAOM BR117]|uniref:Peptidase M20 domain-containing protein 2 n=1 Tax=Spizellomyces punctatus (strain DAOM BR117) TaxID=645134 RepID=A0A0L0HA87_SPIPD|nr:amidohydrolase [Spizellomyces punctatus DAOM BR117]KNC97824.1 amidohydrolase [Spizellomyces punctatus DAOM BR117]|eukprot:XP_016605864.1 amidohydrolase [Spizellomyces punctatus DAOM BR117]